MTRAKSVNSTGTGTYEFLLKTRMLTKNKARSRIFDLSLYRTAYRNIYFNSLLCSIVLFKFKIMTVKNYFGLKLNLKVTIVYRSCMRICDKNSF